MSNQQFYESKYKLRISGRDITSRPDGSAVTISSTEEEVTIHKAMDNKNMAGIKVDECKDITFSVMRGSDDHKFLIGLYVQQKNASKNQEDIFSMTATATDLNDPARSGYLLSNVYFKQAPSFSMEFTNQAIEINMYALNSSEKGVVIPL